MGKVDTWRPNNYVVDAAAMSLPENDRRATVRRDDDLANAEISKSLEEKIQKEGCNFCGHPTPRDFCSGKCETDAAFASIGNSLKFHEE